MRLVTFVSNGQPRLGALVDGQTVVDLNRADPQLPAEAIAFLEAGPDARARATKALATAPAAARFALSAVTLKAPILRPGKIICIGLNYRDHAKESGQAIPEYPTVFAKFANAVVGPKDPVSKGITEKLDYEAEMAFVIGKRAKSVPEAQALDYVAGYMCCNDISARDYQSRTSQWVIGKTFDTFAPMGPALVTADEIPDPQALDIQLSINGKVYQKSNTCNLIFGVASLIAHISAVLTLEPGDVISTGTPGGVGFAQKPEPRWLLPSDVVRMEIQNIGALENPIVK
jgi:acylpyruvate hydrolase